MADYSLGGGYSGGYGDGGLGLGTGGSSSGVGLGAPSGGYFGGGGSYSGGSGGGLSATTDDMFSYNPTFSGGYSPSTSYSLGDVYSQDSGTGMTFDGSLGLKMPGNPYADTGKGFGGQEQESDWWDSEMGKFVKSLGKFALSTNPIGRMALTGYGLYNAAQNKDYGSLASGLVGTATGNGLLGAAAGIGTNAAMGKSVAGQVGSTLGGVVGGSIAGPVGAYAGSRVGAMAGNSPASGFTGERGYSDKTLGGGGGSKQFGMTDALGTLAGLYSANRAQSAAKANTLDLSSMYGPNSAYAQQLRQQLARRDAAGGRRSQYGPREVELQAKLAQMMAQAGPGIMNQNLAAQQQANANRNSQLNLLLKAGKDTGAFDYLERGLGNLFSSNNSQPLYFDNNTQGTVYSV